MNLTHETAVTVRQYTAPACRTAHHMNSVEGEGATACSPTGSAHEGARMIKAGRELAEGGIKELDVVLVNDDNDEEYGLVIDSTLCPQYAQYEIQKHIGDSVSCWTAYLTDTREWLTTSEL